MTVQRVILTNAGDGRRTTKFYNADELNALWGFCAKMVFLVPFIYSSITIETVDQETYDNWIRVQNERDAAADRAKQAWADFVKTEAGEF